MYENYYGDGRMKRTIIDICAMTSFVIVVMLGASALNVYLTRESRIKENQDWLREVVEKEVYKQIEFMIPNESEGVYVPNK